MERLQWVQILRAIAACSVVLHHALYYAITRDLIAGDRNGSIFEAGVDLFFVISGFVMMMMTDPTRITNLSPAVFLKNRFTRIMPMYWIYLSMLAAAGLLAPSIFRTTVINGDVLWYSFLLIPFRDEDAVAPVLRVGWSLVYEAWFYALIAATLRFGMWWRAIVVAAVFAVVVGAANSTGPETEVARYLANTMIFEFLAGMLIYMGYRRFANLPAGVSMALIAAGLAWLVASSFVGLPTLQDRFAMWGVPAVLIVTGALYLPATRGSVGRVFEVLGDSSYSIYLSHLFTIGAMYPVCRFLGLVSPAALIASATLASMAVGVVSYWVLERPLLRWSRRAARRNKQPA